MQAYLILGATYAFAAAVQPGQLQAYLISQAIANGWRRTLPAALSPLLSDIPVICLTLLVLTQVPPLLVHVLQLVGGVFLLYLSYRAFEACRNLEQSKETAPASAHRTVLKAALVNLLNPNPYLSWALIMGPLLLKGWHQAPVNGIALIVAFYFTMIAASAGIILLFAQARSFGPRIARLLVAVSAVALASFGFYQVWSGAQTLLASGSQHERNMSVFSSGIWL